MKPPPAFHGASSIGAVLYSESFYISASIDTELWPESLQQNWKAASCVTHDDSCIEHACVQRFSYLPTADRREGWQHYSVV